MGRLCEGVMILLGVTCARITPGKLVNRGRERSLRSKGDEAVGLLFPLGQFHGLDDAMIEPAPAADFQATP